MAAVLTPTPRPTPSPPLTSFRGGTDVAHIQRASLRVSSPQDAAEREAAAAARAVMTSNMGGPEMAPHTPQRSSRPGTPGALLETPGSGVIGRQPAGYDASRGGTDARIPGPAGGTPLPASVRGFMEPRFGADFGGVRIHTDGGAAVLSRQLSAQAFTTGNHIFFGGGQYQPETPSGRQLIAHELAHTVQQGAAPRAAVQRSADLTLTPRPRGLVQRLGLSDALDYFADKATIIPGFRMFTIVLGVNPINMRRVERSAANILRAVVEFIPGGGLITQALDQYGVFDRAGRWIEQQIDSLGLSWQTIRNAVTGFLDSLSWTDIFDLGGVWERAKRIFSEPADRIIRFVGGLASAILQMIKDAILQPLARLAQSTRGWDLLCAVLGRNPITGEPVPRNAETLIGGFMKLIGQEEVWRNIQRSNAIGRAWAWFQGALNGLLGFVREIPSLFLQALRSLEIADIVLLPRAFLRVGAVFGGFALRFIGWAGEQVMSLLTIIFEVVAPQVMVYLRRAAGAFRMIIADPIRFIGNLVRAGLQGLRQFASNFLTHLRASLIGWLTGAMSGANIYIPQGFNLREIVKFILSVLGLTWQNIRGKLVRVIGETAVGALETTFDIVVTLVREGPAAAWEKIVEQITNLRDMVLEQVMTFVRDRVVQAAITRLVTSLNPAGAFIQAIIAIYNTVMFFVERMRQIAQVAAAVIDSLDAIARGVIGAAANRVEQTMAGLLTLVISFLARIAGLGRVSDAVINIINRVRQPIDRALDRVVEWIVATARRVGRAIASGARAAVRAVARWLGIRQAFRTEDGEEHALYFERRGGRVALVRASDLAVELVTFLAPLSFPADPEKSQLTRATTLAGRIVLLTRTPEGTEVETTPAQEEEIVRIVSELSRLLVKLVAGGTAPTVPPVDWNQRATSATSQYAKVYFLSSTSAAGGTAAAGTNAEWEFASAGGGWVRMHLIPYSVGGKGGPDNWIPAPIHINSGGPVKSFETAAEELVRSARVSGPGMRERSGRAARPNVIWMEAVATGPLSPAIVDKQNRPLTFFTRLELRSGIYQPTPTTWNKLTAPLSVQRVTLEEPNDTRIKLSKSSGTQMRNSGFPHLTVKSAARPGWLTPVPDYVVRLVDLIKETRGAGFGTYAVLEARLLNATTNSRLFNEQMIKDIVADFRTRSQIQKDLVL
jgi:uncharacterized protein DUF4157